MRILVLAAIVLAMLAMPQPARADATFFVGTTTTPANRPVLGAAAGVSLIVLGFEFEYAKTHEDTSVAAPALTTWMGNLFVQTPFSGIQLYATTGVGAYRERLSVAEETGLGVNAGGGIKVTLLSPIRVRLDYRVFTLRGSPLHAQVHRLYAGLNLAF